MIKKNIFVVVFSLCEGGWRVGGGFTKNPGGGEGGDTRASEFILQRIRWWGGGWSK